MRTKEQLRNELLAMKIVIPPHNKLTRDQVQKVIGCSDVTLRKWRESGCGPRAIKFGGHWKYDADELLEWLNNGDKK